MAADSVGAAEIKDDVAGAGLQVSAGVLSIDVVEAYYMKNGVSNAQGSNMESGDTDLEFTESGGYLADSLQIFLNGMLLRKDHSNSVQYDWSVSSSGGTHTVTLNEALQDSDDVILVRYIKS